MNLRVSVGGRCLAIVWLKKRRLQFVGIGNRKQELEYEDEYW